MPKLTTALHLTLALVLLPLTLNAQEARKKRGGIRKPRIENTVKATVYADNWFKLYINGKLTLVDSIPFIPHNVISVDLLPEYPMTIAVMARDNADPKTGMEYNNTNIGDGGFILKFGDGTVTSAKWKAMNFFHGPVKGASHCVHTAVPENWYAIDFDDRNWPQATVHREEAVGPKQPFYDYDFKGAEWIWTQDLALDNTVLFRYRVEAPPNGSSPQTWPRGDFGDPNCIVSAQSEGPAPASGLPAGRHTFGDNSPVPETAKAFETYRDEVSVSWDDTWVYVRTDSIPEHRMMVGIKAWNQQVPIPHDLEFKLLIKPKLLKTAAPTTLLGPLAIAVNGIPIFDPTTQGGKHDAFEHGELDEFGGHAGRADDYHYHIAPFHLLKKAGKGNPIAFGLDGLPVYADAHGELDEAHGHFHDDGSYHYHGTTEKPYYMSGFRGEVDLDARPRTHGVRPYTRPLRGATITDFLGSLHEGYQLTYELQGEKHQIEYGLTEKGADFAFVNPDGTRREETYDRRSRGGEKGERPSERRGSPPPEGGERKPWITQHKEEIDQNKDGKVSLKEMMSEARQTFVNYDGNKDGKIGEVETREAKSGTAMGGFVRQHFRELDTNSDGWIANDELTSLVHRMFGKADRDANQVIEGAEFDRPSGGGGKRKPRNQPERPRR